MPLSALSGLSTLTSLANDVENPGVAAANAVMDAATSTASGEPSWLGKAVIIVVGLLFIAAGIFSFDKTREVIVQAGKAAATAA